MEPRNFREKFWSAELFIYWAAMAVLILVIAVFEWRIALLSVVILISLIYYSKETRLKKYRSEEEYFADLSKRLNHMARHAFFNLPLAMLTVNPQGEIDWYNRKAEEIWEGRVLLYARIQEFLPDVPWEEAFKGQPAPLRVTLAGRSYFAHVRALKGEDGKAAPGAMIYLEDITELEALQEKYMRSQPVLGIVQIDNYDEVLQSTDEKNRPQLQAEIARLVGEWALQLNGHLRKFAEDSFLLVIDRAGLAHCEQTRFEILDRVREINLGNKLPVTLSIGMGFGRETWSELGKLADLSLDIALGRGGDQAVVKTPDKLTFYGGKSMAVEKRTRVKARVMAHALKELIAEAERVVVMGHENPDLDSLGAALGIHRMGRDMGKPAYIVLEASTPPVEKLLGYIQVEGGEEIIFIDPAEGERLVDAGTLLVIVDTHKPALVGAPQLLQLTERIVVIDHHRRGEEFIDNPTLLYLEPYASSASELVTELLQYAGDKLELTKAEASALLAGIVVDTKNFAFQTGVRTFEAASTLRRAGADPIFVQRLLKNDLETFIMKAEIVKTTEILYNSIAISTYAAKTKYPKLLAAQTSDILLTFEGIKASFVICAADDGVVISARSLGEINVQLVMERLGGGGHLTVAGTRLEGVGVEEARERLKAAIKEIQREGEER